MLNTNIHKSQTTAINLDSDWRFTCLTNSSSFHIEFLSQSFDDHEWTSIQLPHVNDKNDRKFTSHCTSYWYRKRFDLRDQPHVHQQFYLHFESINTSKKRNNHESDVKIPAVTIWLNENEIFSNTLPEPINVTQHLKYDSENILVIQSKQGYRLRFHARLLLPSRLSCQIDLNELEQINSKRNQGKTLDYTADFDESDGLITLFIQALKKHAKRNGMVDDHESDSDIENKKNDKSKPATIDEIVDVKTIINGAIPRLAIVMLIVGTRGDVQPFIALAKALLRYGHRVRLATHETFRNFVRENDIEFYPLAGDPADLMSFMVKNAGIIPSVSSIVAGDIAKSRRVIGEILASTWKACTEDDDETGVPFVAEAIIANPPSYGHIHCAQRLQIPLHIVFTMPWSPTIQFPHPLCKVDYNREPIEKINMLSYDLVEMLTWSGMRNIINDFRKDVLGLPALHTRQAIRIMMDEHVPHTYCWSPSLVPKPADWPNYIDVSGFFFLDLATNYKPPIEILDFLKAGDPPIYIGFGSITGHDAKRLLGVVLEALNTTGYRALLCGFTVDYDQLTDKTFKIDNCPHDWLFQHVAAVCHHGGAGTTAAGLRAGKPTIIVPFFGDQFFWGSMISKSGAGPAPIPGKTITTKQLAAAFEFVHDPKVQAAAVKISSNFQQEHGCEVAVRSFHAHLPLNKMRSELDSSFGACFYLRSYDIQISRPVAQVLVAADAIQESDLSAYPVYGWYTLMQGHRFGALADGFRQAVAKISDSVHNLKRSRSTSAAPRERSRTIDNRIKHEMKSIGQPFKLALPLYGEIENTTTETLSNGNEIRHSLSYALVTLVEKPAEDIKQSAAAMNSPRKNSTKSANTNAKSTNIRRSSSPKKQIQTKKTQEKSKATTQSSPKKEKLSTKKSPEEKAADMSGLPLNVCRDILNEFQKLKDKAAKEKSPHRIHIPHSLHRQRSHSTAAD